MGQRKVSVSAFRKKKTSPIVGIDISSTAVKVIQLSRAGSRFRIDHYAMESIPPGAVNDKVIADTEAVGKAIEQALRRANIKTKLAAVAVAGSGVITKILQIPGTLKSLSEEELESQVELEAANHIPFPIEDVRMDFDVLGPSSTEGFLDVLIAAARNETAVPIQEAAEVAGLTVEIMDVELLALENAYSIVADQLKIPPEDIVALVDIGASVITMNIMQAGRSIYQRQQAFDTKTLENELRRRQGCSQEEALRVLRSGVFPDEFEEGVMEPFRDSLSQNVNRLLQFFYSSSEYNAVHKILLAGGGANTRGLTETLDDRLGIPSSIANPLASMALGSGLKGPDLAADAPALFLATGLALRSFE